MLWLIQAARDGWHTHEAAADSGGSHKSSGGSSAAWRDASSAAVSPVHTGSSADEPVDASVETAAAVPQRVIDAAAARDSMDSLGAPTTRAPSTDLDVQQIKLYREADGRPVLLGRGSHAKVALSTLYKQCPFLAVQLMPLT